jgi:predicted DNA-binding transcriptional regulator AlpA
VPRRGRPAPPEPIAELLTQLQLCDIAQVTPKTVGRWRAAGRGPRWLRVGGQIRYRRSDVEQWLTSREMKA